MTYRYFPTAAQSSASWLLEWTGGVVVVNGTYYFALTAPYSGTIASLDAVTSANTSFVANIQIAGSSVTSLSAVTVNNATITNTVATGANVFAQGQIVTVIITTATNGPTNAALNLRINKAM